MTARTGLLLILAPAFWLGGWALWNYTRIWVPLDIPISLARGVRTAEFKINVESDYSISLGTNTDSHSCLEAVGVPWSLSKHGRVVATGGSRSRQELAWTLWGCVIGQFYAVKGVYRLELDLPQDESLLVVYESGGEFLRGTAQGAHALTTSVMVVPIGIIILILGAIARREEKRAAAAREWSFTQPGALPGASIQIDIRRKPKRAMPSPFAKTGASGLIRATTWLVQFLAVVLSIIVVSSLLEHRVPRGLPIRVVRPGVNPMRSPGIQPLRIRVGVRGLLVDSRLIRPAEFDIFLRNELTRRPPDWPVYVEGDRELEFSTVGQAIDAIRAAPAEVVLLTPGYKAALGE